MAHVWLKSESGTTPKRFIASITPSAPLCRYMNLRRCQAVAVAVKDWVPTPVFWLSMLAPPLGGGFFPQKINNHNEVSMNKNPFVKHRFAALGAIACLSL